MERPRAAATSRRPATAAALPRDTQRRVFRVHALDRMLDSRARLDLVGTFTKHERRAALRSMGHSLEARTEGALLPMSTYQQRNTDVGEKVDNATEGGRYGSADAEEPHLTPEIIPRTLRREYAANVPDSIPGALPENGGFDDSPGKPTEE